MIHHQEIGLDHVQIVNDAEWRDVELHHKQQLRVSSALNLFVSHKWCITSVWSFPEDWTVFSDENSRVLFHDHLITFCYTIIRILKWFNIIKVLFKVLFHVHSWIFSTFSPSSSRARLFNDVKGSMDRKGSIKKNCLLEAPLTARFKKESLRSNWANWS